MKQAGTSGATRSVAVRLSNLVIPSWLVLATALSALVAAAALFAGMRTNSVLIGQQQHLDDLLRVLCLLAIGAGGSLATFVIGVQRKTILGNTDTAAQSVPNALCANDSLLCLMFNENPLPMYVYDCKSLRMQDVNQAAIAAYGYSREQFLQLSVPDVRPGVSRDALVQEMKARHMGFNHAEVWQQRKNDGSSFLAEATVVGYRRQGQEVELVRAVDVTERLEVEVATQKSKARLRSLVDQAPFGVCRISLARNRFESVNPALCAMLGYSEQELLQLPLSKQISAATRNLMELIELLKREGKLRAQEGTFQHKDGRQVRVRVTCFLTGCSTGELDQVDAYVEDLTEQSTLEQQIRAVQKLEAVGRLAGGVAHDFNNILVVIKLSTDMMLNQVTPESPLSKSLLQVSKAADRATALTSQMLAFSRRQVMQLRVVNVNSIVNDMSHLLRRIIGEDVRLVTSLASGLANTKLDPDQLGQVVLNLAVNARDAMPEGGTLQLETSNIRLDEAYAEQHSPVQPGNYVLLVVSDTGVGIAKADLAHIFDPFFTTKELGKGTGLGLSIVYGIVKQSGGYIWAYSEPRQGTTFKLYFPATTAPLEMFPQFAGVAGQASGQTILVVEDEVAIRGNVRDCLQQLGYAVLEAESGEAALQVCEVDGSRIDMVMTDLVMPGIGGQEMARQLVERFPNIPVLFTSGYTEDTVARREMLRRGSSFLAKPFSVADLSGAVRRVLATRSHHNQALQSEAVI